MKYHVICTWLFMWTLSGCVAPESHVCPSMRTDDRFCYVEVDLPKIWNTLEDGSALSVIARVGYKIPVELMAAAPEEIATLRSDETIGMMKAMIGSRSSKEVATEEGRRRFERDTLEILRWVMDDAWGRPQKVDFLVFRVAE